MPSTRSRTAMATLWWPLSARDTVATETFARRATSLMVTASPIVAPRGESPLVGM